MVLDALNALALIGAAFALSVKLGVIAFVLVPIAALPIYLVARRTLAQSFGVRRKGVVLFDMLLQLFRAIRIIKVYQGERVEAERTVHKARHYFDEVIAMERTRALARVALEALAALSLVAVIIAGGLQVLGGSLGWPELLAFLIAARAAQGPLNNVNTSYMDIQRYGASMAHIECAARRASRRFTTLRQRPRSSRRRVICGVEAAGFAFGDTAVLDDVSLRAPRRRDVRHRGSLRRRQDDAPQSGRPVLRPVARIRPLRRQRSSRAAPRRRAPPDRDRRPGPVSLRELDSRQHPLRPCRRRATPRSKHAARAAEIHDEILAMPDGYDTMVGHGGRTLSRGESQRVNIARAVLKNAPILLLDEATSSLDSFSEAKVQRAIDRLPAGRMTIAVAHRLSTLRAAHSYSRARRGSRRRDLARTQSCSRRARSIVDCGRRRSGGPVTPTTPQPLGAPHDCRVARDAPDRRAMIHFVVPAGAWPPRFASTSSSGAGMSRPRFTLSTSESLPDSVAFRARHVRAGRARSTFAGNGGVHERVA